MTHARRWSAGWTVAGLVIGLAACQGCGGSGGVPVSSSRAEATVHGKVTINGKAPTKGKILFNGANTSRRDAPTVSAEIGPDGSYTIKALIGENRVYVDSVETKTGMAAMDVFDVKSGDNEFNMTLPK